MRPSAPGSASRSRRSLRSTLAIPATPSTRWARWFLLLTVLAFALPTGALPVAGAAALPTHISSPAPQAAPTHIVKLTAAPSYNHQGIIGSSGPPGPRLTSAQLNALVLRTPPASVVKAAMAITSSSYKAPPTVYSGPQRTETLQQLGLHGIESRLRNSSSLPALPKTAVYNVPIGYFSGFINDSVDRSGISNAAIQVYSSALCSTNRCPSAQTTSNGSFKIVCPAPGGPGDNDAIVLTTNNWYFDNVSYNTCVANQTTWVGTIYLVRDGVGIGFVKDPTTGKAIVGVTVQAITRDGTFLGYPNSVTGTNGSFEIGLPPVPARVTFSPPPGYEGTFNYTDVTPGTGNRPNVPPWLGGDNMGTFYLVRQTLVKAHLIDGQTNGSLSTDAALTACDAFGNGCLTQGPGVDSSTVEAFANPGWNYFEAYAVGHVETSTVAILVPQEAPGTDFDIGKVTLQPFGVYNVKVEFNDPTGSGGSMWGAPGGTGIYVTDCGMNGYAFSQMIPSGTYFTSAFNMTSDQCGSSNCFGLGGTGQVAGLPLRNFATVIPDTTGFCSPFGPTWPVNGYNPVWQNYTYVNLTAGHSLSTTVDVNFTVGDYVAGHVYVQNTTSAPPNYIVSETSTDNQFWDNEAYNYNTARSPDYGPCSSSGIASGSTSFCIAVPPGNAQITVSAPGYTTNWTWVHTPSYCCKTPTGTAGWPATLAQATENHVQSINLTLAEGLVWGYAVIADTGSSPVPLTSVSVCPASSLSPAPCGSGLGINGTFYAIPAPVGADVVTVSSPGYASDSVWVNVSAGGNVTAGTIPMYPLGVLTGQVDGPGGVPLYLADVKYCTVIQGSACYSGGGTNLGPGTTSSAGTFNGTVLGGWLPWATYVVTVTAPGYTTDWSYGNVTVGNYTTLPTFTLQPIGTNTSRPLHEAQPHGAAGSSSTSTPAAGVWVTGRFFSNASGGVFIGPGSGGAGFCPTAAFVCTPIPDGSNTEGYFNTSLAPGLYYLNISASGYVPISLFVNASQAGFLNMGLIYLEADYWVSGRLVINPWNSVTLSHSGTFGQGYAPAASVSGCSLGRGSCLPGLPAATNGTFNVPIPPGTGATIVASPSGTAYGGTVAGGFQDNVTDVHNITSSNTTLTGTEGILPLDIFGEVAGRVLDNNTVNDSLNLTWPAYGLAFSSYTLLELGNNTGSIGFTTDGFGYWAAFVPGNNGPNATHVLTYCKPAYTSVSYVVQSPLKDGGAVVDAGNASLERFGWVQLQFLSTGTNLPVPGAAANAQYTNPKSGSSYQDHATANQAGFLNLSAPYGADVLVQVTAPDFNSTNFTVAEVNTSQTTFPNSSTPGVLGSYYLPAYGWVLSSEVNFSQGNPPPLTEYPSPAIVDSVNGLGVPNAQVAITSPDVNVPGGGSQTTNWDGQFYSDAPIGPTDGFSVTHPGYLANTTNIAVKSGSYRWVPIVNLTGEAVVAGIVTSNPSNTPISGASVQLCGTVKNQAICSDAVTNVSGVYWVVGPPGALTLTISQTAYVSATSQVQACSDCWAWAGTVQLNEYGSVSGNVRGLPSGFPVDGANVSLCSTLGTPTGPCGPGVGTNQYGHFVISAPPGEYILAVNDTNYNSTFLPVALSPGESTSVGTLFLSEFGTDVGTVYDASRFTPLAGAEVLACAVFSEGTCAPAQVTNNHGQYTFSAAPGTYTLTVSATNYVTAYSKAVVSAGLTTTVSTIPLLPLGSNEPLPVSGTVSDALTSAPIVGATVAALVNGSIAASTETQTGGTFAFNLPFGTYDLLATYYGYGPVYKNNTQVHQALANLAFSLSPMTYTVTGQVTDALTHQALSNAVVSTALAIVGGYTSGAPLATTDQGGTYTIHLTNGTHDLYLQGSGGSPIAYAPQEFQVVVNGNPQTRNLSMTPALSQLDGKVVDSTTGLPLAGATIRIVGQVDGVKYLRTFTSGSDGSFAAQLYVGVYSASTSYGAYQSVQKTFTVAGASTSVTLALSPLPTPVTGSVSTVPAWAIWGAVGVSIAAVAGAIVLAGRPTQRKLSPQGTARTAPAARQP